MAINTQTLRARYPGSRPFTRDDETLFFGRDEDIARLTTFIKVERTTVLYGKSGLGKTSLLNAGALPRLENEHQYYVIPVRFGSYTQGNLKHPLDIAEEQIARNDNRKNFLSEIESEDVSLWQHIKSLEQALSNQTAPNQTAPNQTAPNQTTFLLVFDQFEELFTYPEGIADFAEALADLLYSRVPKSFQRALRLATRNKSDLLTPEQLEFLERPANLKVLMSIRSDRMSLLDSLSSQIPSILLNCYELKPLSRAQAEDAITSPAQKAGEFQSPLFTYQPEALEKILDYLTGNNAKPIESFQLQILCHYVEESIVIAKGDTCVAKDDLGDLETIYQNYYNNSIKKVGTAEEQLKARIFIEEGLIFEKEKRRITLYEGQIQSTFDVSSELLRRLADTHIIRSEPHSSGGYMYEVSHDTLVAPILKAKARRYQSQQEEKIQQHLMEITRQRRKKINRAIAFLVALVVSYLLIVIAISIKSEMADILSVVIIAFIVFLLALQFLEIPATIALVYEFITGESFLSKLRRRAKDPTKQKGIFTKLGRWLS